MRESHVFARPNTQLRLWESSTRNSKTEVVIEGCRAHDDDRQRFDKLETKSSWANSDLQKLIKANCSTRGASKHLKKEANLKEMSAPASSVFGCKLLVSDAQSTTTFISGGH